MKVKITSVDYFVHAMAQMVSCQSVTRVLGCLRPVHLGYVVNKVAVGLVFPPNISIFLPVIIPPMLHTHSFITQGVSSLQQC